MSEYVVHFTKGTPSLPAYDVMLTILSSGTLLPSGPFGAVRWSGALAESQRSVCFSEVPLDRLDRLTSNRSHYGIAFRQDRIIRAGGGRVWYLDDGSAPAGAVRQMIDTRAVPGMNLDDPLWRLTPFIDFPGDAYASPYRFEWEREWRVPGDMRFTAEDVAFLFIPEKFHAEARRFFTQHRDANTGPAYLCPYLDPRWSDERLQDAFAGVPQ